MILFLFFYSNNCLSHSGTLQLANAMRSNSTVKILDLKWNSIGHTGGQALLDMLKFNRTLMVLDLDGNNINQEILSSIGESLSVCVSVSLSCAMMMICHPFFKIVPCVTTRRGIVYLTSFDPVLCLSRKSWNTSNSTKRRRKRS